MGKNLLMFLFFVFTFSFVSGQKINENTERIISELNQLNKKKDKNQNDIAQMLDMSKQLYTQKPDLVLNYLQNIKPLITKK